ncbi:ABC transporter ATP-binding protein/permease [uncultured Methylovirgula sp.]|uniref:ABC transporter ATP-binding protein/permease n=1 Tax=uncultured Methylovirgula sp. TaxID=1285960 RepID=UPI0026079E29|nr:ABC transporter ATP-binding protein/permease [uncultured Methylovirgula sp.]
MKALAIAVALFAVAAALVAAKAEDATTALLAVTAFICAYTTHRSRHISSYLRIFVAIFAIELIVFGALCLVAVLHLWPVSWADYQIPESLPLTVALFAIAVYLTSFVPLVQSMMRIADRYFDSRDVTTARVWPFPSYRAGEHKVATAMVVFLVLINQAEVGINIRLSFFSRDWFNAIQAHDAKTFWYQLFTVFMVWAFLYIFCAVVEYVVTSTLVIRWRRWLTAFYLDHWLDNHRHYRMSLAGTPADNPDQRISEDISRFIDGGDVGYGIYSFTILLISNLSSLVSFAILLWVLSANFTLPGTHIAVPGFLFWVALIYAAIGTWLTHWIGKPLVPLSFKRQRYEADFRFSLARLREYTEQVALLSGEAAEKRSLKTRFSAIVTNYFDIIACRKRLTAFTASYSQISPFIPYIVSAPFYFAGKVTLGIMTQTANAFSNVNSALTFVVTYYVFLADYKAVLDRLTSFDQSIEKADSQEFQPVPMLTPGEAGNVRLVEVTLRLPDGRTIVEDANLDLVSEIPALLVGPSGSGKSTLFRAIAGIWPYGQGKIDLPPSAKLMLLPQKPYVPMGTLRAALAYPAAPDQYDDATLRTAMEAAQLTHLIDRLDADGVWQQQLSGGEQQRLSIARALLEKPDWLFLDEATTAMDEPMEALIYQTLRQSLPKTTIVSIGHRATIEQFHKRRLEMQPAGEGMFTPKDDVANAAE